MNKRSFDTSEIREMIASFPHWYHQIELAPGIITPGIQQSPGHLRHLEKLGFPKDFSGLRVLDIGCADGFFSFTMEQRGAAHVVGVDYRDATSSGFSIAKEILGSQVEFSLDNVYDLTPEKYGTFDVVLFLGVLYHLRNPMLAFDRVRRMMKTDGLLFVETQLIDHYLVMEDGSIKSLDSVSKKLSALPLWQFYRDNRLAKDATSKWVPNMTALRHMIEEAQFEVIKTAVHEARGMVMAKAIENHEREYFRQVDEGKGMW